MFTTTTPYLSGFKDYPEVMSDQETFLGVNRIKQFDDSSHREYQEQKRRDETFAKVDAMDLTLIKKKLCLPESKGGHGWHPKQADAVENLYKDFLRECVTTKHAVPETDVDDMWHTHILFMRKYEKDCMTAFGYILYHEPNEAMLDKCDNGCCVMNCSGGRCAGKPKMLSACSNSGNSCGSIGSDKCQCSNL